MNSLILKNGIVIDGTGKKESQGKTILIQNARIQIKENPDNLNNFPLESVQEVNCSGKYILPGLIDAHVHMCSSTLSDNTENISRVLNSETHLALEAAKNAKKALLNGVTCMRDLGGSSYINIKIRDLINVGFIPGPRIVACGYALSMTGGHGGPGISMEVDGEDEIRKAVRLMRKMGADCIKLMGNGLSVNSPELNVAEMKTAVETAHDAGMKVAVHASVWKAVENAVEAGVDTIEHAYTLNEELIEKIIKKGIILVPTFGTVAQISRIGADIEFWKDRMDAIRKRMETALLSFRLAREMGVRFAVGTDGSNFPLLEVGEMSKEIMAFQEIGFSLEEILQAATLNAAKAVDRESDIGSIENGKLADMLILNRNPLKEIEAYSDIFAVIKDGKILVKDGQIVG